jgi:ribonuclease D
MIQFLSYQYIDTRETLEEGIKNLTSAKVIGVDTEGDSLHSYREKVSLIQISGNGHNLIIDPLALNDLSPLGEIFCKTDILKVFHGTDYDVVALKRDFGFKISAIFDTCLAARASGIQKVSLADLLHRYFNLNVDKRYQKANWSMRPLPKEWLEYAALDSHFLPQLYHLLKTELEMKGRLEMVQEECRLLTQREWNGKPFEPNDYLRIKGVAKLSEQTQRVARSLAVARDRMARSLDKPVFKVISDADLLSIATQLPRTEKELGLLFPRVGHSIRKQAKFWLAAVRHGLEDQSPLPSPPKNRTQPLSEAQQVLFQRLREWRDAQARSEGVEPAMILSSQDLRQLAQTLCTGKEPGPRLWLTTPEDLAKNSFLKQWQIKRYGKELIVLIHSIHPNPKTKPITAFR